MCRRHATVRTSQLSYTVDSTVIRLLCGTHRATRSNLAAEHMAWLCTQQTQKHYNVTSADSIAVQQSVFVASAFPGGIYRGCCSQGGGPFP